MWWKQNFVCVTAQKTALIVYAHQSPASFNAAVRDVTVQELTKQGYKVIVSDLYAMNFKASATQDDIIGEGLAPQSFYFMHHTGALLQDCHRNIYCGCVC